MNLVPREFDLWGVYWPPLVIAVFLAIIAMGVTCYLLNRYRLSRYFAYPVVVSIAITCIYSVLIGTFLLPS